MSKAAIARLTDWLKLFAAVLAAASGLRLITVGLSRASEGDTSDPASQAATSAASADPSRKPRVRRRDAGLPTATSASTKQGKGKQRGGRKQAEVPGLIRLELAVSAGPPGSEVWVKGKRKGASPFLGDVVCKPDEEIKIEVLPPAGMPLEFARVCRPGAPIHVAGE